MRAFYHMRHEDDPALTKSFDLLWRGIELTTGRPARAPLRAARSRRPRSAASTSESIQYYLDFFRYGAPPHGGFGFGLTRLLMMMLGQENVREVTFLYRGPAPARAVERLPMARVLISIPAVDDCLDALAGHELIEGPPGSDAAAEGLLCTPVMPVGRRRRSPRCRRCGRSRSRAPARTRSTSRPRGARGIAVLSAGEALVETTADLAFALILCRIAADGRGGGDAARGPLAWLGLHGDARARRARRHARARRLRARSVARSRDARAGFGMEVLHHTRTPTGEPGWQGDLDALLAGSDIVSLHVPLTDSTRGLIDARRIDLIGPGRGVGEHSARGGRRRNRARRPRSGTAGCCAAGLDVYAHEPRVAPELLAAPRAVLLPHIGSATDATRRAMLRLAAERLAARPRSRSRGSVGRRPARAGQRRR